MIAIIAPEPAPWLGPAVEAAAALGPVWLFAPFALPAPPPLLPGRLRAAWKRRQLALAAHVQTVPGWPAFEVALRRWAHGRADRLIRSRMLARRLVDALAARALPEGVKAVIAPSSSARRTFSAALQRKALRVLVADMPLLRQLHADLDLAARARPASRFLLRHRASAREVAAQEMEQVLADRILVRGRFAAEVLATAGHAARVAPVEALGAVLRGEAVASDARPQPAPALSRGTPRRVLLAGLATARNGSFEALAALERSPDVTLLVRTGEGLEPADLLQRPRVQVATEAERKSLEGVEAVLAPTWCESYPEEVTLAAARGIPVFATARAAGWLALERIGVELEPGDVDGLVRALQGERARSTA